MREKIKIAHSVEIKKEVIRKRDQRIKEIRSIRREEDQGKNHLNIYQVKMKRLIEREGNIQSMIMIHLILKERI